MEIQANKAWHRTCILPKYPKTTFTPGDFNHRNHTLPCPVVDDSACLGSGPETRTALATSYHLGSMGLQVGR